MSQNIDQIFIANPATFLQGTDLFYLGRSPYSSGNDMACQFSVMQAALNGMQSVDVTAATQAIGKNVSYTNTNASQVTYTLPASPALGDIFEITGTPAGAGGWTIVFNSGQTMVVDTNVATTTTGSVTSNNQYNTIRAKCVVAGASAVWVAQSYTGSLAIV